MNLPTKITMVRIFLIPVFVALFFVNFPYHRIVATAVFVLASLTDFLDGYLARKYNLVTDLGKFLDPIADKLLVACALVAVVLDTGKFQIAVAVCSMVILCRELLISGFRIVASSKNVVLAADKLGKIKTVLQMLALIFLLSYVDFAGLSVTASNILHYIGLGLFGAATLMTIISGANYLIKNRQVLKG